MAYHNSTPKSVLEAPTLTPVLLVEHTGPNRFERRHARTRTGALLTVPKQYRAPAFNTPYVKPHGGR